MHETQPEAFSYVKRVKFQVEFPGNQIQYPGSQNPLDRIFYTYGPHSLMFSISQKVKYIQGTYSI